MLVGVVLATWSASLSNMIGASRVLQAVAEDTIFGPFLSFINKGTINNNPIRHGLFNYHISKSSKTICNLEIFCFELFEM